jgi:tetratricopeptide (TPR) repeat protein
VLKATGWCALVLFLSGAYLYAFPTAGLVYGAIVFLHIGIGLALLAAVAFLLGRRALPPGAARVGWLLLLAGGVPGVVLLFTGAARPMSWLLYAHIGLSVAGVAALGVAQWDAARRNPATAMRWAVALVATIALMSGAHALRVLPWERAHRIQNPPMPPADMAGEGDGPRGPFFPSSAQTKHGGLIPSKFFMQSQACQRCHADIYDQWAGSAHRFSSFNNQWYRKSIEYMQEVNGVPSSKWCAGCHDPALLFSGMFDRPIQETINTPEAHAGLACVMCHSITEVKSTMGQGDFTIEYPRLHELAASENPVVRELHDFLVKVNPEPHRRTFLKPFLRNQTADFCSTCHKVHLDVPVNNYRWMRGFNDYDAWQASGVSGQGARAFYYPAQSQKCADCHMPLVPSRDLGHVNGMVHSHRFPAANSALPVANEDSAQFSTIEKFLKDSQVSVDIFALSSAGPVAPGAELGRGDLMTSFAVGEEGELAAPAGGAAPEATPVTAPLNRADAVVRRGDSVRVDVVVRTRKVGHFFPGGTVDAFDVWVELQATDEKGRVIFWSGYVEDEGRGPVEPGAHFYRSLLVDGNSNPINKRNAWAARALVYVRLVPPGAADTVRYRLRIPEDAGERITLKAKLHYRKFMWWNTQFAFAGQRDPHEPRPDVTPHYDNGRWVFTGDTSQVSGKVKAIPLLPAITVAEDVVTVRVAPRTAPQAEPRIVARAEDWTRWNDYGIGLLLQGDLKAADAAFRQITELEPQRTDGWTNMGRARVQEGNLAGAREVLQRALALQPELASANYFYGRVLKGEGKYEEAIGYLQRALARFPRDRVVRNELGRVLFLLRRYPDAIAEFQRTLAIDPEDLQAHYNLMLSYNGLGQIEQAREHEKRYLRFKADESAQALTGPYRRAHPHDNNERQAIHEHAAHALSPARPRMAVQAAPKTGQPASARALPPAGAAPTPASQERPE